MCFFPPIRQSFQDFAASMPATGGSLPSPDSMKERPLETKAVLLDALDGVATEARQKTFPLRVTPRRTEYIIPWHRPTPQATDCVRV